MNDYKILDDNGVEHDVYNLPDGFTAKKLDLRGLDLSMVKLPAFMNVKDLVMGENDFPFAINLNTFDNVHITNFNCKNVTGCPKKNFYCADVQNLSGTFYLDSMMSYSVARSDATNICLKGAPEKTFIFNKVYNYSGALNLSNTKIGIFDGQNMEKITISGSATKMYMIGANNYSGVLDLSNSEVVDITDMDTTNIDKIILSQDLGYLSTGLPLLFPKSKIEYKKVRLKDRLKKIEQSYKDAKNSGAFRYSSLLNKFRR